MRMYSGNFNLKVLNKHKEVIINENEIFIDGNRVVELQRYIAVFIMEALDICFNDKENSILENARDVISVKYVKNKDFFGIERCKIEFKNYKGCERMDYVWDIYDFTVSIDGARNLYKALRVIIND